MNKWHHYDKQFMLFHLVKKAKMELLMDRIKKRIEAKEGKKLDEIADALVVSKLSMQKTKMELRDKFKKIMGE